MTPLRDAMSFIDGDHPNLGSIDHLNEAFVVQSLWSHIKQLQLTILQLGARI